MTDIWANPARGIVSPSIAKGTLAASATAAAALVATAAAAPLTTVARRTRWPVVPVSVVAMLVVGMVAVVTGPAPLGAAVSIAV
jgi:hypothetical protein